MTSEQRGARLLDTRALIDLYELTADQLPTLPKIKHDHAERE